MRPPALDVRSWRRRSLYLLADAGLFGGTLYGAIRAVLLGLEGVSSPLYAGLASCACAGVLLALSAIAPHGAGGFPWRRRLAELSSIGALVALPALVSLRVPAKGESYLWLAGEWTKLPENFWLLGRVAPGGSALLIAVGLALVGLAAAARLGRARILAPLAGLGVVASLTTDMGASQNQYVVYVLLYGAPWLAAAFGLWRSWNRHAARALAMGWALTYLLIFYVGVLPMGDAHFVDSPGVRKIYPVGDAAPEIPLNFLRHLVLDPSTGTLYTAYGPTSGILALDVASGELTKIDIHDGLVRRLWTEPDLDHLYALDWIYGDLLEIQKEPFAIGRRHDIIASRMIVPMSFLVGRERIAIVYTEEPGVRVVSKRDPTSGETLSLRDAGLTRFRSGAWHVVGDADAGELFVELGPVDRAGRFLLARVGLDPLAVTHSSTVPDGGLGILHVPEHDAVLTAAFFADRIHEYDAADLSPRRVISGPLNSRALIHHRGRDLLIASAFLPGELWIMRYSDGQVLRRERVGNKSMSLALDEATDTLYLASRDGVFAISLGLFLGDPDGPAA